MSHTAAKDEVVLKGTGVCPGIVVARARVFLPDANQIKTRSITEEEVKYERTRFQQAMEETRRQLQHIRERVSEVLDEQHAQIFDAHLLVAEDHVLIEDVEQAIEAERLNVEPLLVRVAEKYADALAGIEDKILSERAADIRDVMRRILSNLSNDGSEQLCTIDQPGIVVSKDMLPSDMMSLNMTQVQGFISELGSVSSHTAIMARAMNLPAVVGLRQATAAIQSGDLILIDGSKGYVYVHPSEERLAAYRKRAEDQQVILRELDTLRDKPSETRDGHHIPLTANIELLEELDGVDAGGAKGIGLYRTEFLFISESGLPDEHCQLAAYNQAAISQAPAPVVIRTLDLGADKMIDRDEGHREANPFLGHRAIRLCLARPDLFTTQLRAILRASVHENVCLMYPMVSSLEEVLEANQLLHDCMEDLAAKQIPFNRDIQIGTMIEVPAAALIADQIAPHVDFFSIGTNDLIQYTVAVDRDNEDVAHLYQPTHIAVIRLIKQLVSVCRRFGIRSTVCGQMASTPHLVPLLVGLGVDELSVSPKQAPFIKDVIRKLYYTEAVDLAEKALQAQSAKEVEAHCIDMIREIAPEVLDFID